MVVRCQFSYIVRFLHTMEIILMRHGKPIVDQLARIAPVEMGRWIESYNLSVVETDNVPAASLHLAASPAIVVASTSSRTLSSVQALGRIPVITDPLYCEAELPFTLWRFPRLSPFIWVAFFRLLWFCGYSRGTASLQATQTRARVAAQRLISLAEQGNVLLVGHGIMNRLIGKELIALGWSCLKKQKRSYWSAGIYWFQ
jgi:broad specificity phosphatase PhoE